MTNYEFKHPRCRSTETLAQVFSVGYKANNRQLSLA